MSEDLKHRAAEAALAYVEDGMRLGLGSGSTAAHFVACSVSGSPPGFRGRRPDIGGDCRDRPKAGVPLATLDESRNSTSTLTAPTRSVPDWR